VLTSTILIRPAIAQDEPAIRALVHSERLNPSGLDWPNFVVAADTHGIVGAVQLRHHADGSRELGSLVVAEVARRRGIATRLIDTLLAHEPGRVQMITDATFAARYARWGFTPIAPRQASRCVRLNHRLGRLACVISFFKRRPLRRLVILDRPGRGTP
jgi:N-acetylglutamate synthase-like GNAT family acetyltransferase